jgi:SanA protein
MYMLFLIKLIKFIVSKSFLKFLLSLFISLLIVVFICNIWIIASTKKQLYDSLQDIPENHVGVVLGASKHSKYGGINQYFKYRMQAAAELYKAGKVKHLLLSGDNSKKYYDEPGDMKNYLLQLGIPESAMTLDYAGFRTFDSMIRAKKVFGLKKFTIISQKFHNQRAVFICNHHNIDVIAYNAKDVSDGGGFKTHLREYFAKAKAIIDLITNKEPYFLGDPIQIP